MVNFHRAVIGQHEGIITFLGDLGLSAPPESFYSKRLQAISSIAIASVCCVFVCLGAHSGQKLNISGQKGSQNENFYRIFFKILRN